MSYNNQLPVVQQYFTNIAAIQNVGVLQLILLCKSLGYVTDVPKYHNAEHGLKDTCIAFYVHVHKHIAARIVLS